MPRTQENNQTLLFNRWVLVIAVLSLAVASASGLACNDHDLTAFNASVQSSVVQRTDQINRRPVDILFMVDNSNSMCEEQSILVENFNEFIGGLAKAGADFQIAVINTDAVTPPVGAFRTSPGTYNAPGCASPPDTSVCAGRALPADGVVKRSAYEINPDDPTTFQRLQDDFKCLALTGIDGNGTEMGLENLRQALKNNPTFIRKDPTDPAKDALLAVVFVTDENDCSDGTVALSPGEVYADVLNTNNDRTCEFLRNIEDSCTLSAKNSVPLTVTTTVTDAEGKVTEVIESRTGIEWCAFGDRAIVESFVASGEIDVDCPAGVCANKLVNRREFYEALTTEIGKKPEDIIVASIINQDSSERYDADEVEGDRRIPAACGRVDTLGYRYELFTNMFLDKQRVVGAICEAGKPKAFAEDLGLIADTIGAAINSVCLEGAPAYCTHDGMGDAPCPDGEFCCPNTQLCGVRAKTVNCDGLTEEQCDAAKADNKRVFFEGTPNEYKLCSGFRVVVGETQEDGSLVEYEEGPDFTISYKSADKCGVETPLEVLFKRAPTDNVVVIFPQALRKNLGQ